ncbi:hypothetical protein NS334_17085, partial [Sphingomonas endophytica]
DNSLALADEHPEANVVALGALGFLDAAIAHLDALRDAAHRDGIGGVGARTPGGIDQTLREVAERGLVEQIGGITVSRCRW